MKRMVSELLYSHIRVVVEAEPLEMYQLGQPIEIPKWLDVQKIAQAAVEEYKRQAADVSLR